MTEQKEESVTAILNRLKEQGKTKEIVEWVALKVPENDILDAIDDTWPLAEYLREAGYSVEGP